MIAVERTHEQDRDHDWFPRGVRWRAHVAAGAAWSAAGAGSIAAVIAVPMPEIFAVAAVVLSGAAAVVSDHVGRALTRRALARMARGEVHLADVDQRDEGELVVVRGRIDADEQLTGVLEGGRGVYRRMTFTAMGKSWIHEAAVDFALIDEHGNRILIQGGGARWLIQPRPFRAYQSVALDRPDMPAPVRELVRDNDALLVAASEQILAVGAPVRIVGYKTVTADATGEVVGYRMAPQRGTLRSGPARPLMITSIEGPA
jgi:hypothetical protein